MQLTRAHAAVFKSQQCHTAEEPRERPHQTPEDPKPRPRTKVTASRLLFYARIRYSVYLANANPPRYCARRCASVKCKNEDHEKKPKSSREVIPGPRSHQTSASTGEYWLLLQRHLFGTNLPVPALLPVLQLASPAAVLHDLAPAAGVEFDTLAVARDAAVGARPF